MIYKQKKEQRKDNDISGTNKADTSDLKESCLYNNR